MVAKMSVEEINLRTTMVIACNEKYIYPKKCDPEMK